MTFAFVFPMTREKAEKFKIHESVMLVNRFIRNIIDLEIEENWEKNIIGLKRREIKILKI